MSSDLREKILHVDALPTAPMLAAELLALTSREDVKIVQMATLIERDPALTTKLLKLCNSAAFGLRHKVSSIERATVMLGIRQIKCLAFGFLILNESEMKRADYFDFAHYWKRASVTAVAARSLSDVVSARFAGEAFVAGLLQDIGVLLLQHVAPDAYRAVWEVVRREGKRLHDVEDALLGVNHMEAGEFLLRTWGLPEIIYAPISVHHRPQAFDGPEEWKQVVQVVAVASEIANLFCEGNKSEHLDRVLHACAGFFRIDESRAHALMDKVGTDAAETAWMFDVGENTDFDYEQVRAEAQRELQALQQK